MAADSDWPLTEGTATWLGPPDTMMLTVEPFGADPLGSVPMTLPLGTSDDGWTVTSPGTKPAAVSAARAWSCDLPATVGIGVRFAPFDTMRVTVLPTI